MVNPVVSVLTPCYNAAEFLPAAIESILNQTFRDFEFILINDGSTDNTMDIIEGYAKKDSRIVVITKKNTGMTDSLNIGIKAAKGGWIVRLDADDISFPQRIDKQLNYVIIHPDVVLLGTDYLEVDRYGRLVKRHRYPSEHDPLVRQIEWGGSPFPHSSAVYNTEVVRRIGGYRNRLMGVGDADLWLRMALVGQMHCINEPLIKVRKHQTSMSSDNKNILTLAYVAWVSHNLRKYGYDDPVEQSEEIYQSFLSWLKSRLVEEDVFEAWQLRSDLRQKWYGGPKTNIFIRSSILIMGLANSRQGFKIIYQKLFGSKLADKLANEWVHRQDVRSAMSLS